MTATPARLLGPLRGARSIGSGIAAVGVKELRGRMRGRRAFVILTVHLLLIAGFAWMIESISERSNATTFGSTFSASAQIGQGLFVALLMLQTLIVCVLAPASTSGAISMEREKQTLDLLVTTPISSLAIILGKLLSALVWLFLLLLASIPVTALVFTFGGVAPDDLVRGYVVLIVTTIGLGSVGLFVSALVKRTHAATVLNLVAVLVMTVGSVFIFVFWNIMGGNRGAFPDASCNRSGGIASLQCRPPEAVLYFNPFVAQTDVVCGTETGFGTYCGIISAVTNRPALGFRGGPVPAQGGVVDPSQGAAFTIDRDTFWPRSAIAWLVLSAILIVLSVQLVTPTRRWRIRRGRGRGRKGGIDAAA
ncbi:MAG: ABC transporter permease [Chloroflexota bacterium]|jgi:ABC-type transport system involved in multi-copper enzyme maturation permease subunit